MDVSEEEALPLDVPTGVTTSEAVGIVVEPVASSVAPVDSSVAGVATEPVASSIAGAGVTVASGVVASGAGVTAGVAVSCVEESEEEDPGMEQEARVREVTSASAKSLTIRENDNGLKNT